MPTLLSLLQLLRASQKKMLVAVACGLLFAGTGLVPPLLIRQIIQWITEGGGTLPALLGITGLLLVVYVGRGLFRYGYGRFSHEVSFDVLHSLMVRVYTHLQSLPHSFFHTQRTGGLIARSINDIEAIEDFNRSRHSGNDQRFCAANGHDLCAVLSELAARPGCSAAAAGGQLDRFSRSVKSPHRVASRAAASRRPDRPGAG